MTTRCIIVEDEPLALERLTEYVGRLPSLDLVASFDNAVDALAFVIATKVDLIFLDINLGGMSGIELLETAALPSQIVLTTAHPEFGPQAYELDVTDYLLKPFPFQRFAQAVERAQGNLAKAGIAAAEQLIFVKTESRLEKVLFRDLLFIEGKGDYRKIHTTSKRIMTLQTFGELERIIPPGIACRVHKSYMVALDKIDSVERDQITLGGQVIPISDTYRDRFYAQIGHGRR